MATVGETGAEDDGGDDAEIGERRGVEASALTGAPGGAGEAAGFEQPTLASASTKSMVERRVRGVMTGIRSGGVSG